MIPSVEEIEEYIEHVESLIAASLAAATPDLPHINDALNRLWQDLARFGPQSMPDIHFPALGSFEIPPPPPPPPPPPTPRGLWEASMGWAGEHPWTMAGIGLGIVGAGLLVGYQSYGAGALRHGGGTRLGRGRVTGANGERRQVVVVLGGDHPTVGLALILELEKKGYIVITSVSSPEAVLAIESKSAGYVRALVFDPSQPTTIQYFLRSLTSTLSRRFPLPSAGDPHASPSSIPYIHTIISLLSLPPCAAPSLPPTPLEHLPLSSTYLPHLLTTHFAPLQLIQALLPQLRRHPLGHTHAPGRERRNVIVCLPATEASVGLPFAGAAAMSAAATLRGVDVLRREVKLAALMDSARGGVGGMGAIRVVAVEVGAVGAQTAQTGGVGAEWMKEWTQEERETYGSAVEIGLGEGRWARRPTEVDVVVDKLVDIVRSGNGYGWDDWEARGFLGCFVSVLGRLVVRVGEWLGGDRVVVGAGARTYALASHLPTNLLDTLLSLPYLLLSLLPPSAAPTVTAPPSPLPLKQAQPQQQLQLIQGQKVKAPLSASPDLDVDGDEAGGGSEADVESNEGSGFGSGVEGGMSESWIVEGKPEAEGSA